MLQLQNFHSVRYLDKITKPICPFCIHILLGKIETIVAYYYFLGGKHFLTHVKIIISYLLM